MTIIGLTNSFSFSNSGTLDVQVGTLQMQPGSFTQTGTIDVAAGAIFQRTGGFTNAGTIQGQGSVDVGAGNTLANSGGTLRPAGVGTAGTLSVTGNLNLAGGTVDLDLGGTAAGQSDTLAVSGNVTMGGTLNASLLGGYAPLNGDFIPYLTMTGTASGSFGSTVLPSNMDAGYNLAAGEASRLIFSTTGTKTFLNTASDLNWATAANWSSGALPGAGNTVLISSGFAVAHPSGNDTIGALTINGGNSLDVSGGSLTVSGAATVGGSLAVSGGTLVLNGTSSVHTLGMTGGALNGTGNLTVTNAFNYGSGSVGLSGALDLTHAGNLLLPAMNSLTSLLVNATGHVTLSGDIAASGAGNAIAIAAGLDFTNSGSHVLTANNGRWLVYSQSPASIDKGGLTSSFRHYDSTLGSYTPASVSESGNGFIYAAAGTLTVDTTATGAASHVYGDAPTASLGYTLTGFADAEDNAGNIGIAGSPSFNTPIPNSGSDAGSYNLAYVTGLSSSAGYNFTAGTGLLYNVTQAALTVTANDQSKVYGDALSFAGTEFFAVGLKNGQTVGNVTLASSGESALASVGSSPHVITASAATGGSFNPANYSVTYVDSALTVTPRPLTVSFTPPSKTYDGNATATVGGYALNNLANGDLPGVVATALYDSRHVGAAKTVSYSGIALTGGKASDYSLVVSATGSGTITQLANVAWVGGASGNWSAAANWTGNALPDANNVASVSIPAGAVVTFDAATAATALADLVVASGSSFIMAGSSLGISGSLTTPDYNQTGGTLNGAGSLTVSQNFAKSGGTLGLSGLVNINQAAGNLVFVNDAPISFGTVGTTSGNIDIDVIGGISTSATAMTATGGSLALTAHSPITIGSGGLSATGGIALSAATPSAGSTITLGGALTAGGSVSVAAYGAIAQNADIQGQSIALASTSSNIVVASSAVSSVPSGGSINYSATSGSITSSSGNFAGATPALSGSGTDVATSSTTTTNDIVNTVAKTSEALSDDEVNVPAAAPPPTTEGSGNTFLLASTTQTTGGDTGTFGASEPTVGADTTAGNLVPEAAPTAESPPAGQNQASDEEKKDAGNVDAKKEAGKDKTKDEKDDEKKESRSREEKKQETRQAAKKVAQCSS